MADPAFPLTDERALAALVAERLEAADAALADGRSILRHMLGHDDHDLLTDRIVAQVGGLLRDVAFQLLAAVEAAAGTAEPRGVAEELCDPLARALAAQPLLLGHAHALAFEWTLAETLAERLALDSVLSPLLRDLIASGDADMAATAMRALAAQTRFGQAQRRGELPLIELPGDVLHAALIVMRTWIGETDHARDGDAAAAERAIRAQVDEAASRLGLLQRAISALGGEAVAALDLARGGVALFATALGLGAGLERDSAVMALSGGQTQRLALALRACGLDPSAIDAQFLALHPDAMPPAPVTSLEPDRAAALLAAAEL